MKIEMEKPLSKVGEVGKIVVNKCLVLGMDVNTIKLEKLLILMQIECIRISGKPLFKENIELYKGTVRIKKIDEYFRLYGMGIDKNIRFEEYMSLLYSEEEAIDTVLNKYGNLDHFELEETDDIIKLKKIIGDLKYICPIILVGAVSEWESSYIEEKYVKRIGKMNNNIRCRK